MEKVVTENGKKKTFELDHKELRMFIGENNSTTEEQSRFEGKMGFFCAEKECWIFPSPLDAIKVFQTIN